MNDSNRPLILLIFANDQKAHLESIPEERQLLLDLLQSESVKKLDYEIKLLDYSSVEGVLKALVMDNKRLFFLHFAGHSGTDFLQFDQGRAYAEGIAEQLSRCPKLKVVFFNGCENTGLIKSLKNINIPYIVGTRKPVSDELAKQFSRLFFDHLINKEQAIQSAFNSSLEAIHFTKNKKNRSLDISNTKKDMSWAWISEFITDEWKFASAANDCNRLPELSTEKYPLPNEPFKGLHAYTEADAFIFFGRCSDTLLVLNLLFSSEKIFILQGRSGAGKTSFVKAGLLPYLKNNNDKIYYFDANSPDSLLCDDTDFLIVDHAEKLLRSSSKRIDNIVSFKCNKIIFSIRTEWFGELIDILSKKYNFISNNYLLKPLTKKQLSEVFNSITRLEKTKYRIIFENPPDGHLAEIIINDLQEDSDSALTPMLQLLLKNMYDHIINNESRVIDQRLYQIFKEKGLGLIPHMKEKLINIKNESKNGKKSYYSGLLIDILYLYVNEYNTSKVIEKSSFQKKYSHITYADEILESLEDQHLIMSFYDEKGKSFATKLAHDSLSKYIKIIYDESILPGQISRKEINHIKRGYSSNEKGMALGNVIDSDKLKSVISGLQGTYDVKSNDIEAQLITRSRIAFKKKRRFKIAFVFLFFCLFSPFIYLSLFFTEIYNENILDEEYGKYLTLKLKFKNNNMSSDEYIKNNYQAIVTTLQHLNNSDISIPANISKRYEILQDIDLMRSVIEYRSADTNKESVNELAQSSEASGILALESIASIKQSDFTNKKNIIEFNLFYAKSMQVCTGKETISYVLPLLRKIDKEYLENTKNEKTDLCLIETLKKTKDYK